MLKIWTKTAQSDVFDALSPVLKQYPDLPLEVINDFSSIPETGPMDVLFCLGKEPIEVLSSYKIVPKNRTTTSLRKKLHPVGNGQAMFSYSPGVGVVEYRYFVDLLCDAGMVFKLATTGSIEPTYGDYRYVEDFSDLITRIMAQHALTGKPVDVALDLETLGLDEFALPTLDHPGAYIVSIQLSCALGTADVVYFPSRAAEEHWLGNMEFASQLAWILSSPIVSIRGANLKYDLRWLWQRAGIECTNFRFDTTLVGSMLDENRSNGLDVHAKIYYPVLAGYSDVFDMTVDKSRMDLVPKDQLLPYAGGDADATLGVSQVMKQELLQDAKATAFYVHVLHPAARAFEIVERGGVFVDMNEYKILESDLNKVLAESVQAASKVVGGRIVAKHADPTKPGGMNLTKASFICDFMFSPMGLNLKPKMFTAKSEEISTTTEHLQMFKDVPEAAEFVRLVSEYQGASKMLSTYVTGFQKHLRSDGRFHPSYYFFVGDDSQDEGGTNTGRLSCRGPAFQTIPKHTAWGKRIRRVFCAPPGFVVTERDYSQGELRVIACVANELTMIQAYLDGMDLHVMTSAPFAGLTYEQMIQLKKTDKDAYDAIRQLGKAGNFGLIYGMGAEGFYNYAVSNYGVKDFSIEKAEAFRNSFFQRYPILIEYHKAYKKFAHKYGFVRSPLGRVRHLPLINSPLQAVRAKTERQSINAPVQGTLSDMLLWAGAEEHKAGLTDESPAFGAIHDAMYNYMPEDKVDILIPQHLEIMENLPFHLVDWQPQLKFIADAKYGPNMADLTEWKKAA